MANRDKYKIWAIYPRGTWNTGEQNKTLILVALGRRGRVLNRWYELTDRGEHHIPLLLWQRIQHHMKSYKLFRIALYRSYEWKPDALEHLDLLRKQMPFLTVEDLS